MVFLAAGQGSRIRAERCFQAVTVALVTEAANEKAKLRTLIGELTERMVKALDKPEGEAPEKGKETATFSDLRGALATVCDVYRLLNGTGDLDEGGSALGEMGKRFHGRNQAR
jgi:hypothetical protein